MHKKSNIKITNQNPKLLGKIPVFIVFSVLELHF